MPEEGTRVAALKRGEVDIIETTIARAKELEDAGFKIKEKPDSGDLVLVFNRTWRSDNPLSKKEVREALVLAVDKASILKHILMGRGKLVGHANYLFTTSLALVGYPPFPLTPYDPKKAKQLLASAGYPNGFTIYFYSFLTFLPEQKLVNEAIVGYWKAIGMDVKILEMDYGAFRPIFLKQREPAGPAAHTFAWPSKLTGDWNILSSAEGRDGGMGFGQVGDPVLDQLIEKMRAQNKKEEYIKAERKCGERVVEQYYNTVIASFGTLFGVNKNVPDWNIGMDGYAYRFHTIGSSKAVK
jgi:peptide/nickel transport system substrate-binding protein